MIIVLKTHKEKLCLLLTIALFLALSSGCDKKSKQSHGSHSPTEDGTAVSKIKLSDQPLEEYQINLLAMAFDTATSIPIEPHIKTRSEWQQRVVDASLKLNQPRLALEYTNKIDNWRKGLCYAQVALYYAQNGWKEKAHQLLELAGMEYQKGLQEWRIDQVKIAIAKVHLLLGESSEVEKIESGLHESETGEIDSAKAATESKNSFDTQVEVIDGLIATANFEAVKNALYAYTELYHTYYHDLEKRPFIEDKIRSSWKMLPLFIHYELLTKLTDFSLENNDSQKALRLIEETQALIDEHNWPLKNRISMQAKLSLLRFKAGDENTAALQADSALALFRKEGSNRSKIVNIDKSEAIVPLAESYHGMGNHEKTLEVYKLAVDSAVENPNSRPRAEDITDILCSMALHSVEPDKELEITIAQHIAELGEPW